MAGLRSSASPSVATRVEHTGQMQRKHQHNQCDSCDPQEVRATRAGRPRLATLTGPTVTVGVLGQLSHYDLLGHPRLSTACSVLSRHSVIVKSDCTDGGDASYWTGAEAVD